MPRIEELGYETGRDGAGVLLGPLDVGRDLLAPPLELGLRERRDEHHLREKIEPQAEVFLQHRERHGGPVAARIPLEAAPHELDGAVELGSGVLGRATREHVRGEIREASRIGRIVDGARARVEPHHDDGNGGPLSHEQHDAVGQHFAVGERCGRRRHGERGQPQAQDQAQSSHALSSVECLPTLQHGERDDDTPEHE